MKKHVALALICMLLVCGLSPVNAAKQDATPPYKNPSLPIGQRVNDLVSRMTLEEKISQMMNGAAAIEAMPIDPVS